MYRFVVISKNRILLSSILTRWARCRSPALSTGTSVRVVLHLNTTNCYTAFQLLKCVLLMKRQLPSKSGLRVSKFWVVSSHIFCNWICQSLKTTKYFVTVLSILNRSCKLHYKLVVKVTYTGTNIPKNKQLQPLKFTKSITCFSIIFP